MSDALQILFVTAELPGAATHGGTLWSRQLLATMRDCGAHVTVLGYGDARHGDEISAGAAPPTLPALLRSLSLRRGLSSGRWISNRFRRTLSRVLAQRRWDAVVINGMQMFWTRRLLGKHRVIGVMHQVDSQLYRQLAAQVPRVLRPVYAREARLMARLERHVARADTLWCISAHDRAYFAERHDDVRLVPPVSAMSPAQGGHDRELGLLGNWLWRPNAIALKSFLDHVVPLLPVEWRITVGGNTALTAADYPRVRVLGAVPDAGAFLTGSARIAVPSESVTGCNVKLVDAIGARSGIVASVAAHALAGDCPSHVLVADGPADFAAKLVAAVPGDSAEIAAWHDQRTADARMAVAETLARLRKVL